MQALLRDTVDVLDAAKEAFGEAEFPIAWLLNEPLPVFRQKTAWELIEADRTDDVLAYSTPTRRASSVGSPYFVWALAAFEDLADRGARFVFRLAVALAREVSSAETCPKRRATSFSAFCDCCCDVSHRASSP